MFSARKFSGSKAAKRALAVGVLVSLGLGSSVAMAPGAFAATRLSAVANTSGASGTTPTTSGAGFADAQKKAEAAIDKRLATITQLTSTINSSSHMTADHKTALLGLLSSDTAGLTALRAKIAADTDRATFKADAQSIVTNYRIYLLVDPKVHVTNAADNIVTVSAKETALVTSLNATVAKLNAAGKDTTAIQGDLATANADAQAGAAAVNGQAAAILALQATDYPNNKSSVESARTAVHTGAQDVKNAQQSLKAASKAIKALGGKSGSTTTTTAAV